MDTQRTGPREPGIAPPAGGHLGDGQPHRVGTLATGTPGVATGENVMPVRNRVQWGPVFAGIATAIATLLLMTILGIAIGASVLDPADSGSEIGTWAAVWGAISALLAFFVGGWVAAKSAAVGGSFSGVLNGFLVGAAGLVLILWLTGTGIGNVFGTLSSNLGDVLNIAQDTAQEQDISPTEAETEVEAAVDDATGTLGDIDDEGTFDSVRDSAFGTFLGLLLPLAAAALGGYLGHNERRELIEGTG